MTQTNMDERIRFNQWSESYEQSFMQWLIFDRVHRAVLRELPNEFMPGRILDIGCGTGRLLRRMHSRWPKAVLVGIDPSDGMVSKACQLTPEATIYQATAEHIPVKDATLDLITTTMSFHHWVNQTEGVIEAFRALRPGGFFVLADTNIGHGHPLSRSQVREVFQTAGLFVLRQHYLVPYVTITAGRKD